MWIGSLKNHIRLYTVSLKCNTVEKASLLEYVLATLLIVAEEWNGECHHPDVAAATVVVRLRPLAVPDRHRLNMIVDLQSLFGLNVT
jgi:hypothetical protein